jgi:hypothetical protein
VVAQRQEGRGARDEEGKITSPSSEAGGRPGDPNNERMGGLDSKWQHANKASQKAVLSNCITCKTVPRNRKSDKCSQCQLVVFGMQCTKCHGPHCLPTAPPAPPSAPGGWGCVMGAPPQPPPPATIFPSNNLIRFF